jgi:hypothetical protein
VGHLVECDACGRRENVGVLVDTDLPWIDVIVKEADTPNPGFCSFSCMAQWAIERAAEEVTRA